MANNLQYWTLVCLEITNELFIEVTLWLTKNLRSGDVFCSPFQIDIYFQLPWQKLCSQVIWFVPGNKHVLRFYLLIRQDEVMLEYFPSSSCVMPNNDASLLRLCDTDGSAAVWRGWAKFLETLLLSKRPVNPTIGKLLCSPTFYKTFFMGSVCLLFQLFDWSWSRTRSHWSFNTQRYIKTNVGS